ncbi:MAG TPA: hypothetical protein VEZ48_02375 [Sphingomonadaceae bacterium]|nr:hypothetical protein [Sphingomonadaceae bacterium]
MILLLVPLVGACSAADEQVPVTAAEGSTGGLAGLYERARTGGEPDRLCMAAERSGFRFGLMTRSDGPANCTARGTAERQGDRLKLRIDGAPACDISATTSVGGVTLDAVTGAECSYYCGEAAELTTGTFAKAGSSPADLRKAVDVAGETLC